MLVPGVPGYKFIAGAPKVRSMNVLSPFVVTSGICHWGYATTSFYYTCYCHQQLPWYAYPGTRVGIPTRVPVINAIRTTISTILLILYTFDHCREI
eukprot:2941132-Rhodomonas_salina.2